MNEHKQFCWKNYRWDGSVEFVPWFLAYDQREYRNTSVGGLLEKSTQEISFLGKTVTGAESWVFANNPETKQRSSKRHTTSSLWPKKSQTAKSNLQDTLLHFMVVHALSIVNLCLEGQLWMLLTVSRCCHIYGVKREENDQENGIMDGSCTTAMPEVTWLWRCSSSWWKKPNALIVQPLHLPDLAPRDFLSFPN